MLDKQKVLQWVEDKKEVYAIEPEYVMGSSEVDFCMGAIKVLNMLKQQIRLGEFEEETK